MPALPSSNPEQFVQGAPVLHVQDVKATAAFYRDVLGFTWTLVTKYTLSCGAITLLFILSEMIEAPAASIYSSG
jgi:catechol-2,3-dioxygenase